MQPGPPRTRCIHNLAFPVAIAITGSNIHNPETRPCSQPLGPLLPIQPLRPTESHYSYTKPTSNIHHSQEVFLDFHHPLTTTMTAESSQQQLADPSIDRMDHDLDQDAQEATTSLPNIIPDSQLSPDTYRFPSERLLRRQRHEGKTPLVLVACGSFRFVIPLSRLLFLPSMMTQSEQLY